MEALQRLAREVDRLSVALEPVRGAIPLRETRGWGEIEVRRQATGVRPEPAAQGPRVQAEVELVSTETTTPPTPVETAKIAFSAAAASVPSEPPTEDDEDDEPALDPPGQPTAPPPAAVLPPGIAQVAHLRARMEPQLALLRGGAAWEQAEDPVEAVHRLRVASRRLRAFVRLFAPLLGPKRADRLQKRLRTITRGIGLLREWDVLLEALRAEHANAEPLPRAALEHVIEWAQGQRHKVVRPARKALAAVDLVALADTLDTELDRVCGRMLRLDEALATEANALLEPELARAFDGMPSPKEESEMEGLHEVRIRAKRLRYALDLLRPSLGEERRALRKGLKRVQVAIGEHRDAAQLEGRLRERREALVERGLETLAGALEGVEIGVGRKRREAFERGVAAMGGLSRHVPE